MRFSLFATAIVLCNSVIAERSVVVLFNNGVSDVNSGSCTDADFNKTQAILSTSGLNSTYTKRQLRATVNDDMDDMTESMLLTTEAHHRALWPIQCKNACAGVTPGRCQASGCKGYRRRLHLDGNDQRDLLSGVAFTCTQQIDYINTELNKLVSQNTVTSSCKTLLSKPRNITCYDDVIYGVVEYIKLWDVAPTPQNVLFDDFTGQEIFRSQLVTLESITNDCVDTLRTTLTGHNGYYADNNENNRPFSLYGDNVAKGKFFGKKMPHLGPYELTVVPDDIA